MKRLIALALAATMLICAAVVGTVAYLTDTDHDVNVMVMGNVKINQFEMERVKENGAWVSASETDKYGYTPDKLQSFTQGQRLLPAIYMDGNVKVQNPDGSFTDNGYGVGIPVKPKYPGYTQKIKEAIAADPDAAITAVPKQK